jgi:Na+/proline symporter/signal transduction histidine kinase
VFDAWTMILAGLAYVGLLFAVATWGDRLARARPAGAPRTLIYALTLGVYCTSWTYFGSVGVASRAGLEFVPIYLGPILVFAFGWPLVRTIAAIAKRQNIASIADFISARYGKSEGLGALVAVIAIAGIVPYISIQLKALSFALSTVIGQAGAGGGPPVPLPFSGDIAVFVTGALALFAILFGTRHIDTTEHQDGMMLAIAVESVVKLLAFLTVGVFVTFVMAGGPSRLYDLAAASPAITAIYSGGLAGGRWLTMTFLSICAILLLPRQFHVAVVENANAHDIRRAAWLFPGYLIAINIFVVPVAVAGLLLLPDKGMDGDTFVLALPVAAGSPWVGLIAFIGGLSAATAMVIMETVALSIMACNNVVVPLLLRRRQERGALHLDMGQKLITIRRWAIVVILLLAYSYYWMAGNSAALAQTGLISFAAVAQFAPSFFGGLLWKRATARGASAGILAGFAAWAYTLLIPSFVDSGWLSRGLLEQGPLGLSMLRPRQLFFLEFDPLTHGVLWSLAVNVACFIGFSLMRKPTATERLQADTFVSGELTARGVAGFRLWRMGVSLGQIEETVGRYLGRERARRAFAEFAARQGLRDEPNAEADIATLRFSEHLLASAVGTASSRLVMALLLEQKTKHVRGAYKLLDDASAAIQYNRDLLQSAIDSVPQGIAVFNGERNLICWNRSFRALINLPAELARIGTPLEEVMKELLREAGYAPAQVHPEALRRVEALTVRHESFSERVDNPPRVIDIRGDAMADGGLALTMADITASVQAAEALQRANETLEQRVAARTSELTKLNSELAKAKAEADAANLGKTRFIAAASHDILQPLNAARLFTSTLVERERDSGNADLVANVDASLEAVEDILSALLDISRLDAGAMKPAVTAFRVSDILDTLGREFALAARERGLGLTIVASRLAVRSDRKLLRRILQNLISNAIKYTPNGRVLVGVRRQGSQLRIEVHDTGLGIPPEKQKLIFREFERLDQHKGSEPGLGLGLSIVERICKVLKHPIAVRSEPGNGSLFSVLVPRAADVPAATAGEEAVGSAAPSRISGLKVLVIDNEQAIVDGMFSLLSGWGAEVLCARSAAEAVALDGATLAALDLILADYHIHREAGLAVIDRLRRRTGRAIPAVLITADRSKAVQDLAAAADVHYLRKPVKPAALRASLAHALAQRVAAQ